MDAAREAGYEQTVLENSSPVDTIREMFFRYGFDHGNSHHLGLVSSDKPLVFLSCTVVTRFPRTPVISSS